MKNKFMAIASTLLFVAGFSLSANAGAVQDTDGDGVPDAFDVCALKADPGQADADGDGRGDACECDYDNDGNILGSDIVSILNVYATDSPLHDQSNPKDNVILGDDVVFCLNVYGT